MSETNEGVRGNRLSGSWKGDLSSILRNVRSKGQFSEVTFLVEGREFPAHRNILSSCSQFFDNLLSNGFQETRSNRIPMGEVGADIFGTVLDFISGGTITVDSTEQGLELLSSAHRYELKDLQSFAADELCSDESERICDEDYVSRLLDAAHSPQNEVFKDKLLPVLVEHDKHGSLSFFTKRVNNLDLLEEVVKLPSLRC